jgi:hypothetical protein
MLALRGPACLDADVRPAAEQGTLGENDLQAVRSAYRRLVEAGSMRREVCEPIVTNGGRELLGVSGARGSSVTPELEGCWSLEAMALHDELFDIFGEQRDPSS